MYRVGQFRTMALVACATFALSMMSPVWASDSDESHATDNHGSDKSESTSGSGGSGQSGGSDKPDKPDSSSGGGGSGTDKPDKPDPSSGGGDGGEDDGSDANDHSGSGTGSQGATQSSGSSTVSKSGKTVNQDEALSAVSTGKVVSLPLLLAFMANKFPGEIVDIKLKNKEGQYSYVVEYLSNAAKLRVLTLNAKTLGKL